MKKRRNFTLSEDALKKLSEMADKERRSLSAMVEQLILRGSEKCLN